MLENNGLLLFQDAQKNEPVEKSSGALELFQDSMKDDTRLRASLYRSTALNPEQAVQDRQLSEQYGVPVETVRRNKNKYVGRAEFDNYDFDSMKRDTPRLTAHVENPDIAPIIKDDIAELGYFERWRKDMGQSAQKGADTVTVTELGAKLMLSDFGMGEPLSPSEDLALYRAGSREGQDYNIGFVPGIPAAVAEMAPLLIESAKDALPFAIGTAGVFAGGAVVAGQAGPQVAAPEELITVPAAALGGFGRGMAIAMPAQFAMAEMGGAYYEFSNMSDETGTKLEKEVAGGAALVVGLINGSLESIGFGAVAKHFPGADKVLGKLTTGQIKKMVMTGTGREFFAKLTKAVVQGGAVEGLTESLQEATNVIVGEVARGQSDLDFSVFGVDENAPEDEQLEQFNTFLSDALGRVGEAGVRGAQGGIGFSSAGVTLSQGYDAARARLLREQEQEQISDLFNAARASKTNQRDPKLFENITGDIMAEESVYIDAAKMQEFFQSGGDEADVFTNIPEAQEQMLNAIEHGGDLILPANKVAGYAARNESFAALQEWMRLSPEAITDQDFQDEYFNRILPEIEHLNDRNEVVGQSEAFQRTIKDQIMNSGFTPDTAEQYSVLLREAYDTELSNAESNDVAKIVENLFGNLSVQDGTTPQNRVEPDDLLIDRARALSTGKQAAQKDSRSSLLDFIRAQGGVRNVVDEPNQGGFFTSSTPVQEQERGSDNLAGDLEAMDIDKDARGRKVPKSKRVLREDGKNLDDLALSAWENGYFPEFEERPDLDVLMEAITSELSGNPRFNEFETAEMERDEGALSFAEQLDREGIDINDDNAAIKQRIAELKGEEYGQDGRELVVRHNLNADNLINADKIGGLPVPSLAINKYTEPFDNFGDITLIGNASLVDPKASRKNKVFGADVYSPRYPSITYEIDRDVFNGVIRSLPVDKIKELDLNGIDRIYDDLEGRGVDELLRNDALKAAYLIEKNTLPDIPYAEKKRTIIDKYPDLKKYAGRDYFDLAKEDAEFKEDIKKSLIAEGESIDDAGAFLEDDGEPSFNLLMSYAKEASYYDPDAGAPVDRYELATLINDKIEGDVGYEEWIADQFDKTVKKEKLFDGYTPSGNRRYLPHNLDTVVKILKRELRDGEGFNYGLASVRSKVAKEFKSVRDIKDHADLLVSDAEFDKIKEEMDVVFMALGESLRPYSPMGEGFGFLDAYSEHLKEIAEGRSIEAVMDEYYSGVPDQVMSEIADFMQQLETMPTEYFEAKIQRAVGLEEFSAALVPDGDKYNEAVEVLKKNGVKVARFDPKKDGDKQRALETQNQTFFQGGETKRGSFLFGGTSGETVINVFENRDLSTILHESGHFFLEVQRTLSEHPDASPERQERYQKLLSWMGVEDGSQIERKHHEKFAEAFEVYLESGNAPSMELKDAFRRFKSWLINLWRRLPQLKPDLKVPAEIQDYFDRMLATDDKIEQMRSMPLFRPDPNVLSLLNDQEKKQYIKRSEEAVKESKETLLRKALKEKTRENKKWWKAERDAVRAEVEGMVESMPVYKAHALMTKGELNGEKGDPVKMSRKAIKDQYDEEYIKYLPRGSTTRSGGVNPALIAEQFGFANGDEFLRAMSNLKPMKEAVEQQTDATMLARHGDMLNDGTLEREALQSMQGDKKADVLASELSWVGRFTGKKYPGKQGFKARAREILGDMKVDNAIKPSKYYYAEVKNARQAGKFLANKDFERYAEAKSKQILNHYLYSESSKAQETTQKALKRFNKYTKKPKKGAVKLDEDYRQKIVALLDKYNLGPRLSDSKRTRLEMQALFNWIEAQNNGDDAVTLITPPELLEADEKTHYRDLTLEEFRALADTVDNLAAQGKNKRTLTLEGKKRDLDVDRANVANAILDKSNPTGLVNSHKVDRDRKRLLKNAAGILLTPDQMVKDLDGREDMGVVYEHIKAPIDRAVTDKLLPMRDDLAEKLDKVYEILPKETLTELKKANTSKHLTRLYDVANSRVQYNKEQIIALALNWGNESNREALIEGLRKQGVSQEVVEEHIFTNLSKEEWDFVQGAWDLFDEYWPETAKVEKQRTGFAPEKVASSPVETPYGVYEGGYYPLKYDSNESLWVNEETIQEKMNDMKVGRFGRAATKRGRTIERVGSGGRPVLLEMSTITGALSETVQDLAMGEAVSYVDSVLNSKQVKDAFTETNNIEYARALDIWLKDTAVGELVSGDVISKLFRKVRTNFTVSVLGLNLGTALLQPLGYFSTLAELGGEYAGKGLKRVMTSPWVGDDSVFNKVNNASNFMAERTKTFNKDIWDAQRKALGKVTDLPANIVSGFFWHIAKAQQIVDVATWLGAYEKGIDQYGEEGKAIAFADRMVARTQSSGIFSDRTAIERGTISNNIRQTELIRIWTTLISYFIAKSSLAYNKTADTNFKDINQVMRWSMDMSLLFFVEGAIVAAMRNQWPDDDEEQSKFMFGLGIVRSSVLSGVPFVREFESELGGFRGGSAMSNLYDRFGKAAEQINQGEFDKALVKNLNNMGGILIGYPSSATNKVIGYLWDKAEGEDVSVADALIYREKK